MKHTFRKCLSIVLALATLFSVCVLPLSAAPTASDPKCNHYAYITETNYVRTQAATCTVEGGEIYNCPKCGENFVHKDTWQNPLDHDWVWNEEDSTAPTGYAASEKGTKVWECSRCDATKTTDWFKGCEGPHTVVTGTDSATCTTPGTRTDSCENCDWTQTVNTPVLGHIWNDGVVTTRPICGETNGVITFTCTRAGCDVDAATEGAQAGTYEVEEIAAVNHEWKWYAENLGSCGVDGNKAAYQCVQCDVWSYDGITIATDAVIDNPEHNWVVCTETGEGHEHEGTAFDGCHAGVVYLYCTNSICGICYADERVPTENYTIGQTGNHVMKWDAETQTATVSSGLTKIPATKCMQYAKYQCACGYVVTSVIPADQKQHNWVWPTGTGEVLPTCNTYGYKSCYDCGATEGYADINGDPIPGNEKYNKLNHIPAIYFGIMPEVGSEAFQTLMTNLGATYHSATCAGAAYYEWNCPHANCTNATVANGGTGVTYKYYVGNPNDHTLVTVPHEDPTCTEKGVVGGTYCSACDIATGILVTKAEAEKEIDALGHTWESATDVVKDPFQGETKTSTNSYWGKVDANCSYAAHEGVLCGRCDLEQKNGPKRNYDTSDPANGKHVYVPGYSEELITPATCTTPALLRYYCYVCNAEEETALNPGEIVGHDFEKDTTIKPVLCVPATCQNDGYFVYFCLDCEKLVIGDTIKFTYEDHDRFVSHFQFSGDPATDVSAKYDSTIEAWVFALTPTGHDAINPAKFDQVDLVYNATSNTFSVVLASGVALKDVINAPEASADGSSTGYIGFDNPATTEVEGYNETTNLGVCGIYSYYEWNCSECGYRYNKHIEDQFGLTGVHAEVAVVDEMNCATGHKGVSGATKCARCGNGLKAGIEIPVKHTIDKTLAGYIGETAATCLLPGWDEYGVCTVCTAYYAANGETGMAPTYTIDASGNVFRYNGFEEALGHDVGELVAKFTATCLLPGYDAHYLCTRDCGYVLNNAGIDFEAEDWEDALTTANWVTEAAMIASAGTATVINGYTAALGHDFNTPSNLLAMLCGKDGYTWYDCGRVGCTGAAKVVNYKFGYYEHRYSDLSKVTDVKCLESYCLCQNVVEYVITNETTGAETAGTEKCLNKNVLRAAEAHKNAAGEVIDITDCLFYDDVEDHKCVACENTFTIDEYDHKGEATHKLVAANCQNYSYELWACERCAQGWIANKGNTLGGHDYQIPLSDGYVAPTWTTTGYRKMQCLYCDDVTETVLKAADVFFEMDIANKFGGTVLVNGGMMAVTVKMTAPGTAIYSVRMGVKFNPDVLEWVPSTETITNVFGANVTEVWCDNNTMDSVMIYAHAEKDAAGKMQNINLKGTETLVTLYFQINPEFYDLNTLKNAFEVSSIDFDDITVTTYDATASTKANYVAGDEFVEINYDASATATDADPIKVETQIYGSGIPEVKPNQALNGSNDKGAYKLVIYKLGDLNKDGVVGTVDAGMFYEIIVKAGAYNAQADLDKNGVLEMADFLMMKQLMVNKLTYAEVAKR